MVETRRRGEKKPKNGGDKQQAKGEGTEVIPLCDILASGFMCWGPTNNKGRSKGGRSDQIRACVVASGPKMCVMGSGDE